MESSSEPSARTVGSPRREWSERDRRPAPGCVGHSRPSSPAARTAASVVTGATLFVAFGAMALGVPWFWVAFPVGFGGVMPAVLAAVARRERRANPAGRDPDPLEQLQRRYVRGELSETEFEARLETLLAAGEAGE